jgi:hypothetical protein
VQRWCARGSVASKKTAKLCQVKYVVGVSCCCSGPRFGTQPNASKIYCGEPNFGMEIDGEKISYMTLFENLIANMTIKSFYFSR